MPISLLETSFYLFVPTKRKIICWYEMLLIPYPLLWHCSLADREGNNSSWTFTAWVTGRATTVPEHSLLGWQEWQQQFLNIHFLGDRKGNNSSWTFTAWVTGRATTVPEYSLLGWQEGQQQFLNIHFLGIQSNYSENLFLTKQDWKLFFIVAFNC